MNNIQDIFNVLEKRQTYSEIAEAANVSRNTLYNVRKNPDRVTLRILRQIVNAMGYNLILSLEKIDTNDTVAQNQA